MPDATGPDLTGRAVLVTGAGHGLGATTARVLEELGARVVAADRATLDVTSTESVRRAVVASERELGPLDGLVCNAGVAGPTAPLWEVTDQEWSDTLEVNLNGVRRCCAAVLPGMVRRDTGSVVVVGSVTGKRPLAGRTPYAASKLALVGLVRSAALDLAGTGVRVNLVAPGPIEGERLRRVVAAAGSTVTEMFGDQPPVTEERVAAEIAHLLSDGATGSGADVDVVR